MRSISIIKNMKSHLIIGFFLILICNIHTIHYIMSDCNNEFDLSIFDFLIFPLGNGLLRGVLLVFPIIIVFLGYLYKLLDYNKSPYSLIRERSKKDLWKKNSKVIVIVAFMYTFIIVLLAYFMSGVALGDFSNKVCEEGSTFFYAYGHLGNWSKIVPYLNTGCLLFSIFIAIFFGLVAIGLLIEVLKLFLKTKYVYLIIALELFFGTFSEKKLFFLTRMNINLGDFFNIEVMIVKIMSLLILSVILYLSGRELVEKKDFL